MRGLLEAALGTSCRFCCVPQWTRHRARGVRFDDWRSVCVPARFRSSGLLGWTNPRRRGPRADSSRSRGRDGWRRHHAGRCWRRPTAVRHADAASIDRCWLQARETPRSPHSGCCSLAIPPCAMARRNETPEKAETPRVPRLATHNPFFPVTGTQPKARVVSLCPSLASGLLAVAKSWG